MRLWHKDLIPVLPRKQLLGQWRECCAIAKSISETGTPNHILVNRIMDYPLAHFYSYGLMIVREMFKRNYKCNYSKFAMYIDVDKVNPIKVMRTSNSDGVLIDHVTNEIDKKLLFNDWHNDRYLQQCYYNLQEKYDCGGITGEEWELIEKVRCKKWQQVKRSLKRN